MSELRKLETWRKDLAKAETIEEISLLSDGSEAYQILLKKQGIVKEKIDEIGEFNIDVAVCMGDWLNKYFPSASRKFAGHQKEPAKMPITKKESSRVRKLKKTQEEKPAIYEKIKQEIKSSEDALNAKSLYKQIRIKENEDKREKIKQEAKDAEKLTGEKKYRIIYADPPWQYIGGKPLSDHYGDVQKQYPSMKIEDICDLEIIEDKKVKDITYSDAVLFLWVTAPKLPEALKIINAWGFQYKTCIIWDKVKHNFGFYFSIRHELLLIAGKGISTPDKKKLYDSVFVIERSKIHSEKPKKFREIIDELYIEGNRIEIFARGKLPDNWDKYGNE